MDKLSRKQKRFAILVGCGEWQSEAYRVVYARGGNERTMRVAACRCAQVPKVRAEIDRIAARVRGVDAAEKEREKGRMLAALDRPVAAEPLCLFPGWTAGLRIAPAGEYRAPKPGKAVNWQRLLMRAARAGGL